MSWKETAAPVLTRMPTVARPEGHVPFRRKLGWTAGVLVLYFFLTNVQLFGVADSAGIFGQFRALLAGGKGSVLHLGIGPIVTASIVLQLLGGADLLGLDTSSNPRDQALYQGLQKLLVVVMIFLTGIPLVFVGGLIQPSSAIAQQLGIGLFAMKWLIFAQIFVGAILVLFMDEIISKWGVGSGIGLFIVAGVSQTLVGGFFGWSGLSASSANGFFATWIMILTGQFPLGPVLSSQGLWTIFFGQGQIVALFTTVLIFAIVVYAESVKIEIPLSHAKVRGARGRFPVKLIYASVLPMILVRALQANIQFIGRILHSWWGKPMPNWLGVYDGGRAIEGLFYYSHQCGLLTGSRRLVQSR